MSKQRETRRAFTLIEMLVVIAIISILAGLLLPALVKAQKSAQQVSCTNNQRQVGSAMHQYAEAHRGRFVMEKDPVLGNGLFWHQILAAGEFIPPWSIGSKVNESSPVWCPGNNNWARTRSDGWYARYFPGYAVPCGTYAGKTGLCGNVTNATPFIPSRAVASVVSPSRVLMLLEVGTKIDDNSGSSGGIYYTADDGGSGLSPQGSQPDGFGRHPEPLMGTNILFVDNHVAFFNDGYGLWTGWVYDRANVILKYPFNFDLTE